MDKHDKQELYHEISANWGAVIFDPAGELIAVLDLDSHAPGAFDETDQEGLEHVAALLRPAMREKLRAAGVRQRAWPRALIAAFSVS